MNRFLPAVMLAISLAGCQTDGPLLPSTSDPVLERSSSSAAAAPLFVHRAPSAPPFKDEIATVRVRPGEAAEATLAFADGSPFAKFVLPAAALNDATINGDPVLAGEEITITLRRVDASRFYVKLEPAGLVFNPEAPPTIIFDYTHARVPEHVGALEVWKQHQVGEAWIKTTTVDDRRSRSAKGQVDDFSGFTLSFPG